MHESSLAHKIFESVMAVAQTNDAAKITSIKIGIGKLTHVNPDQLLFCLQILVKNSIAERAIIETEFISPTGKCVCGYENEINIPDEGYNFSGYSHSVHEYAGLTCPQCRKILQLAGGNDLIIKTIEIER